MFQIRTILLALPVCGFLLLLSKFYIARRAVWKLQKANLPMPEFKLLAGHFLALKGILMHLPTNTTMHTTMHHLSKRFPSGIFYINLWPFSGNLLVITTPSAAAQVQALELEKPPILCEPLDSLTGGPSLITMRGPTWKKWRTLFNPGFSAGYMMGLAPLIADEVAIFCGLLRERVKRGEMFQLEDLTLKLTIDVIGSVTLDTRLRYQTQDNLLASALQKQIEWTSFGTKLNPIKRYLTIRPFVLWHNSRRMNGYIEAEIEKRFAERVQERTSQVDKKRSKSIISLVLDRYLEEEQIKDGAAPPKKIFKKITAPQLRLFLFAGRDTTSSTLLYCFYLLATHPKELARLTEEHNQVFGTDATQARELISQEPQRLNQLPFTSAVIKEVLRLFPPSASMRQGRAGADIFDDEGQRYPTEGCNVWNLTLALHRNANYWKEADSFIPDRWLVGPEDPLYPVKGGWRAMEFGPRSCIGQTLALLELRIALVMTMREFRFMPAYDEWDDLHPRVGVKEVNGCRAYQAEKGGGGAHPADGLPIRVVLRENNDDQDEQDGKDGKDEKDEKH